MRSLGSTFWPASPLPALNTGRSGADTGRSGSQYPSTVNLILANVTHPELFHYTYICTLVPASQAIRGLAISSTAINRITEVSCRVSAEAFVHSYASTNHSEARCHNIILRCCPWHSPPSRRDCLRLWLPRYHCYTGEWIVGINDVQEKHGESDMGYDVRLSKLRVEPVSARSAIYYLI